MKHAALSVDWQLMVLSWLFCGLAVLILVLALTGCSKPPDDDFQGRQVAGVSYMRYDSKTKGYLCSMNGEKEHPCSREEERQFTDQIK